MIELLSAVVIALGAGNCGGGPGPDPFPGASAPVTCTDWTYDYRLAAVDSVTGKPYPELYFQCHHDKDSVVDTCTLRARKPRIKRD